jgi:hypothetical protein
MVINKTSAVEVSIHAVSPALILLASIKVGLLNTSATGATAGADVAVTSTGASAGVDAVLATEMAGSDAVDVCAYDGLVNKIMLSAAKSNSAESVGIFIKEAFYKNLRHWHTTCLRCSIFHAMPDISGFNRSSWAVCRSAIALHIPEGESAPNQTTCIF